MKKIVMLSILLLAGANSVKASKISDLFSWFSKKNKVPEKIIPTYTKSKKILLVGAAAITTAVIIYTILRSAKKETTTE